VMLWIVPNQVTDTCKEHYRLAESLKVPVVIVVSKIDKVSEDGMYETIQEIEYMIEESQKCETWRNPDTSDILDDCTWQGGSKSILEINEVEDVLLWSRNMSTEIIPIFKISNVTCQGVELLLHFLNLLEEE
jgi:GTPase